MNRDYYGYDTSQLPCRNKEHSTFKDTNNKDHFTDFWWNADALRLHQNLNKPTNKPLEVVRKRSEVTMRVERYVR